MFFQEVNKMHNILSSNQLAEWNHFNDLSHESQDQIEKINDYYNCMLECKIDNTPDSICKVILNPSPEYSDYY
jgi:hypothetical protein